jgi:PHD/YefM family antitoxin component YafN of YafNO toxin-antitoxin module
MVVYSRDEMISVTELLKSFRQTLNRIADHSIEKIAVMKNNKPEAVVLSVDEYERIKALADLAEDFEIAKIIQERRKTSTKAYIPFEEVLQKAGIDPNDL